MPLPEFHTTKLLTFIRATPRSSQACRDHMDLKAIETESLLAKLRDDGAIAFANGEWYVVDSNRQARKKPTKKPHPRQTDFFNSEAGHQYEGPSKQVREYERQWRAEKGRMVG